MQQKKIINGYPFIPYHQVTFDEPEMEKRSLAFLSEMNTRRSVRDFSSRPVSIELINSILSTALTAPSGANKQPLTFCVVSDGVLKKQIRMAAEKEEHESYTNRMSEEWLEDLKPLQTDWQKPFLETAPYLIVVFKKSYNVWDDGTKRKNYYVSESVGLACGLMLAAIHHAGLAALTHTPSPMDFLTTLLNRPGNERPFLLIPVGYPADETWVPDIKRKSLAEVTVYY